MEDESATNPDEYRPPRSRKRRTMRRQRGFSDAAPEEPRYAHESFYAGVEYEPEEPKVKISDVAVDCGRYHDDNFYDGAGDLPAASEPLHVSNGIGGKQDKPGRDEKSRTEEKYGRNPTVVELAEEDNIAGKPNAASEQYFWPQNSIDKVNQKAGRNLPAAILVGCGLIVVVLSGLFLWQPLLLLMAVCFMCLAAWELYTAFSSRGHVFPIFPVLTGIVSILIITYFTNARGLLMVFGLSVVAFIVWTSLEFVVKSRTVTIGLLTITWIGFLPSFVFLLYGQGQDASGNGHWKVLLIVLSVVANDTFAYLSGLFWGKHPMAPQVSPKKSWEGFIGGGVAAVIVATTYSVFILQVSWIFGVVFGLSMAVFATCGDLVESLVKRGIGTKDMSGLLPGHGGVLDRLDSLLLSIPAGWMLFTFVMPVIG